MKCILTEVGGSPLKIKDVTLYWREDNTPIINIETDDLAKWPVCVREIRGPGNRFGITLGESIELVSSWIDVKFICETDREKALFTQDYDPPILAHIEGYKGVYMFTVLKSLDYTESTKLTKLRPNNHD